MRAEPSACRRARTVAADINGVPVNSDEQIHLIKLNPNGTPRWQRNEDGKLTIWDFTFLMTVTCEDEAGNTTVETLVPEFRKKKTRTPAYRREIGAFDMT